MEEKIKDQPKKSNLKKILLIIFGICLALFIIIIGIAAWITSLVLDKKPLEELTRMPNHKLIESVTKKFGVDLKKDKKKKKNLAQQLLNLLMTPSKTVELTKDEVNALLESGTIAARVYLSKKIPNLSLADMRFKNGCLCADLSLNINISTPFGKYINGKIKLIPTIIDNKSHLVISTLTIGGINFSGSRVQPIIDKDLIEFEKTENGEALLNIVQNLTVTDDYIKVTFKPQELTLFIARKLGSKDDGGMGMLQGLLK